MNARRFSRLLAALFVTMVFVFALTFLITSSSLSNAQAKPLIYPNGATRYVSTNGNDTADDCTDNATPCRTIQHAIDIAQDGDEIRVAAGIYTGVNVRPRSDITNTGVVTQVVYLNKTIGIRGGYTVTNWTTPDSTLNLTTLDAQRQGRVFYVTGNVSPTIESLHITGGSASGLGGDTVTVDAGGGVYAITAAVTVRDCQVFNNSANRGGGAYLRNTKNATLSGNSFFSNTTQNKGGGLNIYFSDNLTFSRNSVFSNSAQHNGGGVLFYTCNNATISQNNVFTNTTTWSGGGMFFDSCNGTISDNTVTDNFANNLGGGIFLYAGNNATLSSNTVASNKANLGGGGLCLVSSSPTFLGNKILSNSGGSGGGLYLFQNSNPTLLNTVVADNHTTTQGAGLYIEGSSPYLLHSTIARNSGGDGTGVHVTLTSTVALTNTILVSHTVGVSITDNNTVTVNGVLWFGTPVTVSQATTATISVQNEHWGDPVFATDGYHITPISVAMDAGVDAKVTTDIDGNHRPYGFAPDLGADEIIAASVLTNADSTLIYTDTNTLTTMVQVPAGAVTETTMLVYTPVDTVTAPSGLIFARHAFDLNAYQGSTLVPGFVFSKPVTITIHYSDTDVAGLDESSLVLRYWTASAWASDGITVIERNPAQNYAVFTITHLCQFALFGIAGPTQVAGVSLTANQSSTVYPGQSIVYLHTLTNTGTGTDSFTVTASIDRSGWSVVAAPSIVGPLGPGIASGVVVTVTAPGGITTTVTATARITATSQFDVNVTSMVTDVTTARPYQVYLPIVIK
jgi:hypothetical protein